MTQRPTEPPSFTDHLALLTEFVNRRQEIVERLEDLLNAKGKGYLQVKEYEYFRRRLGAAFFDLPGLPPHLTLLRGQLQAKRLADGFLPIVTEDLSNGDIDPVEFIARGLDHWEHTTWPGRNIRLTYAHTLYALFMLRQLEDLSLLTLEQEAEQTGGFLRDIQTLLDRLNATKIPNVPVFVRDARWVMQTAQSPATQQIRPYFVTARQLSRSFAETDRLEIHKAGAKMAGGHLRSQLRYETQKKGCSINDVAIVAETRTSNAMDNALLVYDLVALLEAYEKACLQQDTAKRLDLADAILQGVSTGPELFLTRLDLLAPVTIIEDLFVDRGEDGQPRYTPLGEWHIECLSRYGELIHRLAASLAEDAAAFQPAGNGYSPYGIAYGFSSDIIGNMALRTLIAKTPFDFSLEDAFVGSSNAEDKLAWTKAWKTGRRASGELAILEYSDEFAAQIYERMMGALRGRSALGHGRDGSQRPRGRLFVLPKSVEVESLADGLMPEGIVPAQEFVRSTADGYAMKNIDHDRREGRCLVSYESDGEWVAISKSVLTYIMGQGKDALITDSPPRAVEVLRLTCPGVVVLPGDQPTAMHRVLPAGGD
jgi:hypothetical protein